MTREDAHHVVMKGATLTRRQLLLDLFVGLSLCATYVGAEYLAVPKRWILPAIAIALGGFGVHLYRRKDESLADFGFSAEGLAKTTKATAAFTLFASLLILIYARATGSSLWSGSMAILLPLYPIYGIAQQGFVQGLLHRRFRALTNSPWLAILLTRSTFALLHLGDARLVALTFVAGLAWSLIYSRTSNVWPLGLSHGLLAALAYPMLLGDNPLERF